MPAVGGDGCNAGETDAGFGGVAAGMAGVVGVVASGAVGVVGVVAGAVLVVVFVVVAGVGGGFVVEAVVAGIRDVAGLLRRMSGHS